MKTLLRKKSDSFFFILLFLGFFYKFFFLNKVQQFLLYDMDYYRIIAGKMMGGEIVADILGKTYGYPAFLAGIFFVFGKENFFAVKIIQILLDLIGACILFSIAKRIFGTRAAWISFILSLLSPLTSAYPGLIMPEVLTMCIMTLILLVITGKNFVTQKRWWFVWGILLGSLLFTRFQFYYFIFVVTAILGIVCFNGINRIRFIAITFICVLLISSYTLFANYHLHHVVSLAPLKSGMWAFLYLDYFGIRYPELLTEIDHVPDFYLKLLTSYLQTAYDKNYSGIDVLNAHYKSLFLTQLPQKWPLFITNVSKNVILLWDKRILASYTDPFYPKDVWILRILNIILMVLFFSGILHFFKNQKIKAIRSPLFLFTVSLFIYMTLAFSLVSNESRHTIAFYPIIYLWSGYGLTYFIGKANIKE